MALAQSRYGDPLEILIRDEENSCKSCEHYSKIQAFGGTHAVCDKRQPVGKKCKFHRIVSEK
jgi:hypothetical protein